MNRQALEVGAVAVGAVYLAALTWSMGNLSYDIWGALLLAPVYGLLGLALVRRMFLESAMRPVVLALSWGMLFKLFGAFARYWVGFEAYDGSIDAGRYHDFARAKAGEIWSGERPWIEAIPTETGTEFVDEFTALVYTLTGGSQLAGFVTFSFMAFIGIVFFVKAAVVAIPGMAAKKYAWLCVLAPSLVYWPSSIGKEAIVLMGLGVGTYGIALVLARRLWFQGLALMIIGLGFTALIRPHMAGIWVGGAIAGLILASFVGIRGESGRGGRVGALLILAVAGVAFAGIAQFTVEFLDATRFDDESSSVTDILEETARRTSQAGSNFVPPSIASPLNWPYAIARTLTRPLPIEASGLAQLVSAAEMLALFALVVFSWKRVRRLPRMLVSNPYVLFSVAALVLAGLAYTSLANLGVLTRQKSLLFPLLLLVPCLPREQPSALRGSDRHRDSTGAPVEAVSPHVRSVGASASLDQRDIDAFWSEEVR